MNLFQKIFQRFLKQFFLANGREPMTPAEWMEIQNQAVRHLNKTKGAPSIKKDVPPFQGWDPKIVPKVEEKITIDDLLKGPVTVDGPKGPRTWDLSQKRGEVIDFPKKPKRGIEELIENEDIFVGKAPKTKKSTLDAKKERDLLLRDADEDIARIKKENKDAIERFKQKMDKKDPDKFYAGGIAPLVGEPSYAAHFYDDRTPMAGGALVKGGRWFLKSLYDTKKQLMQLDIPLSQKKELMKQADDAIKHIEGGGPIPEQIIQHIRKDPKFKSVSQGPRATDPDLAEMEEVILEYGKRHAEGGRVSYSGGGKAGLPAITQETQTPNLTMQGPQMPVSAPQPTGIPGANLQQNQMDLMQQKMQQNPWMQNQMKQGIGGMQNPQYKGQFRMPFGIGGLTRRAFLKMMAAGAALPFIGKGVSKVAPKAIKETTEVITRGADGMPAYITDLIEVVKAKGTKDFVEGFKRSDYSTVHSYKGVDVIEDGAGNIKIKKPHESGGTYIDDAGESQGFEGISHEVGMEIRKGEWIEPTKTKKGIKTADEYVEYTAKPDMDGKLKDVEEYIDDMDHLELKEIADEVDTLMIKKTKKASGGLAYALGE